MPSWDRNISDHGLKIQYTQITTDKCFCSQVTVKQFTVFFYGSFKDTPRSNWENSITSSNETWLTPYHNQKVPGSNLTWNLVRLIRTQSCDYVKMNY